MFKPSRLSAVLFATLLTTLGCHAQSPASPASSPAIAAPVVGKPLSPELARRVEVLLRQKAPLPPGSTIQVGVPASSEFPGYSLISVTFSNDGKSSRPINFLISADGKTLAQFTKFDISADPKNLVSAEGRPARGGPVTAPVLIVGFDDLECPFCARLHESIFPAMINRYGDKVRIVYKDFPLDTIHPWAEHAAVDVNCIGAQSPVGYWNLVDGIHAHASDIGTSDDPKDTQKTLANATAQLDKLTREQGKLQKVDAVKLDACLAKQDTASVDASKAVGVSLGLEEAPTLFINGDKVSGALPVEFIFGIIDDALRAQGLTPPPPYVAPTTTASVAGGK
ncbi:thioredoxin domain-containing protein [Granulicella mallensis]|uniref:Protein-disulfide isomerase n=1 Tax=Granulicella mallensis TaxID=940614 RepID=A0A7W8E979_9BACT|nr:thioredoxin domain-containing protein [Granulicella mallensis]MBB5063319.1 protein-disulfide isomerase [Granulicella mallensis]